MQTSEYANSRYLIAAILGSEYCSGYIDVAGKWNTGFYCPASDDNANIFCCGTPEDKFCCTKQDQVALDTRYIATESINETWNKIYNTTHNI